MSLGLFIGSLVVLAIGLLVSGSGYYTGETINEKYNLNCGENIFDLYTEECHNLKYSIGTNIGIILGAGIFVLVGFTASIIFGVKLAIDTRKRRRGEIK
jgi:hypothetical protein